jgi:hypothetical protein
MEGIVEQLRREAEISYKIPDISDQRSGDGTSQDQMISPSRSTEKRRPFEAQGKQAAALQSDSVPDH